MGYVLKVVICENTNFPSNKTSNYSEVPWLGQNPGLTQKAIELRPAFISPETSVHDVFNEGLIRWAPIDVQWPGVGLQDLRMSQ